MKIGILTFHFAYNYGAMLQAYALRTYLNSKGAEPEIIDYRPGKINYLYRPGFMDWCRHPYEITANKLRQKLYNTDFTHFEEFLSNDLKPVKNDTAFDCIVAGSDQIWNPDITKCDSKYLLSEYKDNVRKFSYGASLGKKKFDSSWEYAIKQYLNAFDLISVREEESKNYLASLLPEKEIFSVPDPVFLFSAETWRMLEHKTDAPDEYILFYSLSMDEELQKNAAILSKHENIPVVSIHPLFPMAVSNGITKSDIGPREFLWLIEHARFICTDSFHATAFSMILGKSAVLKKDYDKGGRIHNLLKQLNAAPTDLYDGIKKYETNDLSALSQYGRQGIDFLDKVIYGGN